MCPTYTADPGGTGGTYRSSAGTAGRTWNTWATHNDSTASAHSTSAAWTAWSEGTVSNATPINYDPAYYIPVHQTPKQLEAAAEASRQRKEKREQANARAEELLRSMLTQEQQDQLNIMSAFIIETELRKYRIRRGRSTNVDELDGSGKVVARLCAHPREGVPNADTMLAQMLMLQTDEAEFRRIANISVIR